jgi:hypothetical protein
MKPSDDVVDSSLIESFFSTGRPDFFLVGSFFIKQLPNEDKSKWIEHYLSQFRDQLRSTSAKSLLCLLAIKFLQPWFPNALAPLGICDCVVEFFLELQQFCTEDEEVLALFIETACQMTPDFAVDFVSEGAPFLTQPGAIRQLLASVGRLLGNDGADEEKVRALVATIQGFLPAATQALSQILHLKIQMKHDDSYYSLISFYLTAATKMMKRVDVHEDLLRGLAEFVTELLMKKYDSVVILNAALVFVQSLLGRFPEYAIQKFASSVLNGIFDPSFCATHSIWIEYELKVTQIHSLMCQKGGDPFIESLQSILGEFGVSAEWVIQYTQPDQSKLPEKRKRLMDLFQELNDSFRGADY